MGGLGGFLVICLIFTFGYGVGVINFVTDFEDNCEMTYIYEYPQFIRISNDLDHKYPKYGLYAYSEGRFTSAVRNMHFTGIPVLFIPGNAGSHKQVRSLSSIALRRALSKGIPYHFDYFTLDLNHELSGLYGALLFDQLQYVNSSLYRILELYKEKNKPESVVIIAHSMGGVIAVKLASEVSDPKLIPLVITLASPLVRPPFILDYHMKNFYEDAFSNIPADTTLVSLSGGYSDFLIPPFLNNLKEHSSLFAVTTNVPRTWVETNHVQILWCKQVVLAITRALFDIVSVKSKQISTDAKYRSMVFHHHLVHNSGINIRYQNSYSNVTQINHKGKWIENISKQYSIKHLVGVDEPHWYMVKLNTLPGYGMVSILAINLETVEWVYVCNAYLPKGPSRVCTEVHHLTTLSEMAPSMKYKRRYLQVNLQDLKRNYTDCTHLVFKVLPTDEPVVFHVDTYDASERSTTVDIPNWWTFRKEVIVPATLESSVHYDLVLPQLEHVIQYFQLYVEPTNCSKNYHHASASLIVPWSNEAYHTFFTNNLRKPANIRLYSSKPKGASPCYIRLILEPTCTYKISIKPSIWGSLGQMARVYSPLLLTNVAVIVLMSLRHQLQCLEKNVQCSILFVALKEGVKPYFVLTATKMFLQMSEIFLPNSAAKPDWLYLVNDGTDFFLLPVFLYLCSVGIVFLMGIGLAVSLVALESTVHKTALKILAKSVSFNLCWSDYLLKALHKVPIIVVATLVLLCVSTCGSLALCLGCAFYFLRLTQMSQDYVEDVVWHVAKKFARKIKRMLFKVKPENTGSESKTCVNALTPTDKDREDSAGDENTCHTLAGDVRNALGNSSDDCDINTTVEACDVMKVEKLDNEAGAEQNVTEQTSSNKDGQIVLKDEQTCDKQFVSNEQNIDRSKEGGILPGYSSIFFHSTMFLLWLIITIINIPAVLTWARNFPFNKTLMPDDSFIPGIILSTCAFPLWQFELPKSDRKWLDKIQVFVLVVAIISLLYATTSVFRLNYMLTATVAVVTFQQLLAPKTDDNSSTENTEDDRTKYENVKTKLE